MKILARTALCFFFYFLRLIARYVDPTYHNPRRFSNSRLRLVGVELGGRVLNVSGWEDRDGEGGFYRDYFPNANAYLVSNVGRGGKSHSSSVTEVKNYENLIIDLSKPVGEHLVGKFDVVFNHTTIEHLKNGTQAIDNLISLTEDILVLVWPVVQQYHPGDGYDDYHRFTPANICQYLADSGMKVEMCELNDQPFFPIYAVVVASKKFSISGATLGWRIQLSYGDHLGGRFCGYL